MKSFATSICPIKNFSCLEYEASPRYPRAIPAWQVGLRHGDLAHRCFRAISAWRSSHLSALRHGDPVYRHLRAISTWQSVLLTGLWNGHLAHRCLSGLLAEPL